MITIIIIVITCIISFSAFKNNNLYNKCILYPYGMNDKKEWYRFISSGFVHGDELHLAFNIISFYTFGKVTENMFQSLFKEYGTVAFLFLYLSAIVISDLSSFFKNKNNSKYGSLGASGAVSAVIFVYIILIPKAKIGLMLIPFVDAPAYVFGPIYLAMSYYLAKRGRGHINHEAHFYGAVYGIGFIIVACALFSTYTPVQKFIEQVF